MAETKSLSRGSVLRFGVFQVNLAARELRKHGVADLNRAVLGRSQKSAARHQDGRGGRVIHGQRIPAEPPDSVLPLQATDPGRVSNTQARVSKAARRDNIFLSPMNARTEAGPPRLGLGA